jgi:glutaconyl-CoA decarboxylase
MPGKIWKLPVKEGDSVTEGQLVLILEAMKMENEIFAPVSGRVLQVLCKEGDPVISGDNLISIG